MNGLELVRGTLSSTTPCNGITDVRSQISESFSSGFGLVQALTETCFVSIEGGIIHTHDGHDPLAGLVQEVRIFDTNKELHLWREDDGTFSGRLRQDGQGKPCDHVDAVQIMFGTRSVVEGQWSRLSEERYADLVIPGEFHDVQPDVCRVGIRTRNYICYSPDGVAGYEDSRFMAIELVRGGTT